VRATPSTRVRRTVAALLVNHILILLGAFFLIAAPGKDHGAWIATGVAMVTVGIGIEVSIIVWAATLVRHDRTTSPRPEGDSPGESPRGGRWLCTNCGWSGTPRTLVLCPRCHRPAMRLL
jgi:hypothetical protein